MLVRTLVFVASTLLLAGCGVTGNFRHDPGYAEFGSLKRLDADGDFGLSLGPLPLKLARWVLADETEVRPLLEELRAVRVYTFEGVHDAALADDVDELTAELVADGWLNVIAIREGAERTSVLLRPGAAGANRGLTVIVEEPTEVVLVNLIGNVRLDLINGYMAELEVETPALTIDPATLQAASSAVEHVRHEQ